MKKLVTNNRHILISFLLKEMRRGKRGSRAVDSYWLSKATYEALPKTLRLTPGEISHFIKNYMMDDNYNGFVVDFYKEGKCGRNRYFLEDLNGTD